MHVSWRVGFIALTAAGLASAASIPSDALIPAVAPHGPALHWTTEWDGSNNLAERSKSTDWFGPSAFFTSAIGAAVCAGGAVFSGPIPCGIVLGAALAGILFSTSASFLHRSGRERDPGPLDMDGLYHWKYSSGETPMFDQVIKAYNETRDDLPVRVGTTDCSGNVLSRCFSIWYSSEPLSNVTLHHLQVRPIDYDFRAPTTSAQISGDNLYGGYVFDNFSEETLSHIIGLGQTQFASSVTDDMISLYHDKGAFANEGCYCMDYNNDGDISTTGKGFFYYFSGDNGYPAGSEKSIYDVCAQETATKK